MSPDFIKSSKLLSGVANVGRGHDVAAIEPAERPLARDVLGHFLGDSRADHIADACTPQIVKDHPSVDHFCLGLERGPRGAA
jgi:hypothetical protein